MTRMMLVLCVCALAVCVTGCASQAELKSVAEKADAASAAVTEMQASVTEMQASVAAANAQLAAIAARVAKAETDATLAREQFPAIKEEMAKFADQFKDMDASVEQARALLVKNLENARDIYKTQFLALEEVLQNMKSAQESPDAETMPPAEE